MFKLNSEYLSIQMQYPCYICRSPSHHATVLSITISEHIKLMCIFVINKVECWHYSGRILWVQDQPSIRWVDRELSVLLQDPEQGVCGTGRPARYTDLHPRWQYSKHHLLPGKPLACFHIFNGCKYYASFCDFHYYFHETVFF